jgi:hypothetical protein
MNLLISSAVFWICMRSVFGGCHTGKMDDQWFGIRTSTDEDWSGTASRIHGAIYTSGSWSSWRLLDNAGCTDYQYGAYDYFDDFKTVTAPWEAIALYSCTDDAMLIESVYFWDGADQHEVGTWDPAIFGPFPQNCVYCNGDVCKPDAAFDLRLDNDYCPCAGVIFGTPTSGTKGTVWTGTRINPPDCSATYSDVNPYEPSPQTPVNMVNDSMDEFAERLLNYLMVTVAMAALLVVSNLCLVSGAVRNKRYTQAYEKVVDSERD